MEKYSSDNTHIAQLSEKDFSVLRTFQSVNLDLNNFLIRDAIEYQKMKLGITYLLFNYQAKLVSYTTLSMGSLKIPDKEEFKFLGKRIFEYSKEFPGSFPALLIGKLATDKTQESKGGASLLLDYAVRLSIELREKIGCSYIVAHAYPETVSWYQKKGFKTYVKEFKNLETIPMYFEL